VNTEYYQGHDETNESTLANIVFPPKTKIKRLFFLIEEENKATKTRMMNIL
jgi:hypothetical protein